MLFNYILIVAIIVAVLVALHKYFNSLNKYEYDESDSEFKTDMDLDYLVKETAKAFSRTLKTNINDDNLSKEAYLTKRKRISALRQSLTEAGWGNPVAKRIVKNNIKELLADDLYGIDNNTINEIIDFTNPKKISSQQKFEILLYMYNREYGINGFDEMMQDWNLHKPVMHNNEQRYIVTKDTIDIVYQGVLQGTGLDYEECKLRDRTLNFEDKIEILTQAIYERYIGFGAVDMLVDTTIDEIDAGVSGIPKGSFVVKTDAEIGSYSYDSIWITYHGLNIHMECMTFGSQKELIRVCDNIYKYDAQEVLSRNKGSVTGVMMDGSRIVACRPPFAESYSFFLRKFNSAPSVDPQKLIIGKNSIIPILMMKWMLKGQRNTAITGSQNTGKTTLLKSVIRFIDPMYNLRIQELKFELNLRYAYPDRNIETFQETPSIDAQAGLNIQKKTNGSVNIIGEVATAVQASHIIQTARVASLFALFTHHASTAGDLVEAISDNLLQLGIYSNKKDAVTMTASILNIDCHLTRVKDNRHIERITEIIPISQKEYPSFYEEDMTDENKIKMDMPEYFKRMTNPSLYEVRDLVKWEILTDKDGNAITDDRGMEIGVFKMVNRPSETMIKEIREKLSIEEEKQFLRDMDMMERLSNGEDSEEVRKWMQLAM